MLTLSAKIRKQQGKKVKNLREKGLLPAILYGPEIENSPLTVDRKEFEKVLREAGESSLLTLKVRDKKKEFLVLIHDVKRDPITLEPIHVDFYQPKLKEKVEATVPLVFEGESKAVKDLEGTLVKNISELEVKALPQKLPKEIKINIETLKDFEDNILIKDLGISEDVEILKDPEEVVASVARPEKVEEELEKQVEEKVEEVEKVEEKVVEEKVMKKKKEIMK